MARGRVEMAEKDPVATLDLWIRGGKERLALSVAIRSVTIPVSIDSEHTDQCNDESDENGPWRV
jgi:hypothetical protein